MRRALRIVAKGRVQKVGFRMFVEELAQTFDIDGSVRNCPDGSVEIIAAGEDQSIRSFVEQVEIGPPHGRVDELQTFSHDESDIISGFRVVR